MTDIKESDHSDIGLIEIQTELKESYLNYAMSVIVTRALPDARDGLKPVHRRILYAMHTLSNTYNRPYKKSARVVGDVIGKYHPHGDVAVYDALVRMAQEFSMRYTLVEGQGNFGSLDGDSPAAMRYTEVRMSQMTSHLLMDLEKNSVDFSLNYDGAETMPDVLPSRIPTLLVNGSQGIAVGMATDIPPHNLTEVCDASLELLDNPDMEITDLMKIIKGPDFPTGGIINGVTGIYNAYQTGHGSIKLRAQVDIVTNKDRDIIVINEIPYQVNKARMIEQIVELTKSDRQVLTGISEIRDESDKDGVRVVIELKAGEIGEIVLNNLYAHTQMQRSVKCNFVALHGRVPGQFNLKQLLKLWLDHRIEVITRRSRFDLAKAKQKGHQLEGLSLALSNIDEVIQLIRASATSDEAKEKLSAQDWPLKDMASLIILTGELGLKPESDELDFSKYGLIECKNIDEVNAESFYRLSPIQIRAILDMRLQRLTGLEHEQLLKEYGECVELIADLKEILSSPDRLKNEIRSEIIGVKEKFGDERKTPILIVEEDFSTGDLIQPEERILTLSNLGYAKSQPVLEYRTQNRGGTGMRATKLKDSDFVEHFLTANTHDEILMFTNMGKVFRKTMYEFPVASRESRGKPIVNFVQLEDGEYVTSLLKVSKNESEELLLVMATKFGVIKKARLNDFARIRRNGLRAISLRENDQMIGAVVITSSEYLMLVTNRGYSLKFDSGEVRTVGRSAIGVRGIRLRGDDIVVSLLKVQTDRDILFVTENGYGKRTNEKEFSPKRRGGMGVIGIVTKGRNGAVVWCGHVDDEQDVALINSKGGLIRTPVDTIPTLSTRTKGVRIIRLKDDTKLSKAVLLDREEDEEPDEELSSDESIDQDDSGTESEGQATSNEETATDTDPSSTSETDSPSTPDSGTDNGELES